MARDRFYLFSLNGGMVSPLALGRTDLARMRLTAETFQNGFPRVIGPMWFRGGLGYLGSTYGNGVARQIPFIFSVDDTAHIELSNDLMRVIVDNEIVTRPVVATSVTNGDFSSTAGWTLTTTGGGIANINSTVANALVLQTPVRGGSALAKRAVTVAAPDQNIEHAIRLTVLFGTVRLRVGSTDGGQEYLAEEEYSPGVYSLVFTPTGTFYPQLIAESETRVVVDELQIEAGGDLSLVAPWPSSALFTLRYDQSGDVIFVTHDTYQTHRIERRGHARSWGLATYQFKDGPWRGKTAKASLTPSVRLGNGTLTASKAFFDPDMVGTLFEITHTQTTAGVSLAGNDVYTDSVRVAGKDEGSVRNVTWAITGTWVGTITVQHSYDEGETWQNRSTYTSNNSNTYQPGTDNTIVFVRIGFQAGDYTSGTAVIALSQPGGGGTGVVRVTGYTSSTVVDMEVVKRLHYTGATENWQEGKYSDYRGWPSAVCLFEGRLWFGGKDQIAGSFSDDFTDFDVDEEGDSAPIIRSIATGPVNKVQWLLGLARLIIGTSGAESVARSSSFDEPMTPGNFSIKDASTYGSADIAGVKIDRSGMFVHRSGKRAYDCSFSVEANDYTSNEISRYNPTILEAGVKIMAVQRNPDTRIWFVLDDGTAAVLVYEKGEDVIAWVTFVTDGEVEDISVLPNADSDDVHMIVNRTIDGVTKRYRELLAYDTNALGGNDNYMADAYVIRTLAASTTVGTLSHLEAKDVVVWADGSPILDGYGNPMVFTVDGAEITLPAPVTGDVIVGIAYEGRWKSSKLAYAAQTGTAMSVKKSIGKVAPILYSTHLRAVLFGQDFDNMDPLPLVFKMETLPFDTLLPEYDYDSFAVPGGWSNDSRLCMKMRSPLPAVCLGVGIAMEGHEPG